jgi:hypothetical protein
MQLAMRVMVVPVPWAHSGRGRRFKTLLDAALATRESGQSVWFVLEDGSLMTPNQVSDLHKACDDGCVLDFSLD